MTLQATSLAWSEEDIVAGLKSSGTTAPIEVTALDVSCGGSPCAASGDFHAAKLKIGSSGSVSYGSRLTVGEFEEDMVSTYTLDYEALPFIKESNDSWNSPISYRCDNGVAQTGSAGCVIPNAAPTLDLSIKQAGASAAMFKWAQEHMTEHWGLQGKGSALTRASGTVGDDNRGVVCDSSFRRQGTVVVKGGRNDVDSCDEFPFAATVQSGAATLKKEKKTGAACAQLQSVRTANSGTEAAQWGNVKVTGKPNLAAPYPDWSRTYPPEHPWIRVGTTGEWGFALDESASGFGDYAQDAAYALSAGTEAILVTHTASIDGFHYYADEIEVAAFEPLRAWERWGTDPDRFVPQMRTVGLAVSPPPPGSYPPFRNPRIAALDMLTLALGVQLPREVALGRLLTVQRD